ncbi:MAG: peptide chain release factor N(5)-glutamine methyltransferase [Pseudomonadota bacterium]
MPDQPTVGEWLRSAGGKIKAMQSSTPELDARLLLQEATGMSASRLISMSGERLETKSLSRVNAMLERRLDGEPVHRILGWREFYGRKFCLSGDTLVPRPETEILVEAVLEPMQDRREEIRILDIGTGSGVIAITLAAELSNSEIVATDVSEDALATARGNAEFIGVTARTSFVHSDLFENVDAKFDLIVSNPPYIPDREIGLLQKDVQLFDPHRALAGGEDGLDFYRAIFAECRNHLTDDGAVYVEIGMGQAEDVTLIANKNGFDAVTTFPDLSGIVRVVEAKRTTVAKIHNNGRIASS